MDLGRCTSETVAHFETLANIFDRFTQITGCRSTLTIHLPTCLTLKNALFSPFLSPKTT